MMTRYQCSNCLRHYARSDTLRRHINDIRKQMEDMESDERESSSAQEEETDSMEEETDTDEENAIAHSSTSDPWPQLLSQTYDELQENFDDEKIIFNKIPNRLRKKLIATLGPITYVSPLKSMKILRN